MTDMREAVMTGKNTTGQSVRRPISPHLQIYRLQITTMLSIFHRIAGCALAAGTLLLVWWLVAVASSDAAYATVSWFMRTPVGYLLLVGWTAALWFHFCNGIRHLAWDAGFGFELRQVHASGIAVLAATVVLTLLTWIIVLL